MRTLSIALVTTLVAACTDGGLVDSTGATGYKDLGKAGGEVRTDAVKVTIPEGALAQGTRVEIRPAPEGNPADNIVPVVELLPDGVQFAKPVQLELRFDVNSLPDPTHPELVRVAFVNAGQWEAVGGETVDVGAGTVTAPITHFSRWSLIQPCGPKKGCCVPTCKQGQVLSCLGANVCGYPCTCGAPPDAGTSDAGTGDAGTGDAGTGTGLRYYFTCGDPVCHGYTGGSGAPLCSTEKDSAPCATTGATCDPKDPCNSLLICAKQDPKQQPGGCPISRRKYKQDIHYLDSDELASYGNEVLKMKLATWRYKEDPTKQRLGFIMEDVEPSASVDSRRDLVDLYGYTSMAVAALKLQQQHIEQLEQQVQQLRSDLARRSEAPSKTSPPTRIREVQ